MSLYPEYKSLHLPTIEAEILEKWRAENAFEESIRIHEGAEPFVFYEGPPSANGMPGIHHVISRTLKDLVCRYKTMQGYRVERKGGWDTHGLPVELGVEKELGITKEDIGKKISVEDYNRKCREAVLRYKKEWDEITERMGYWVDLKNPYITYEPAYIESVWWLLKKMYDRGLLYESVSIQPYSPAAGTGLSSHELNMPGTYKEVKDTSVTALFKAIPDEQRHFLYEALEESGLGGADIHFMAWTTTPWTLPSNLGLTAGPGIDYVLVQTFNPYSGVPQAVVLAKALMSKYFKAPAEGATNGDGYAKEAFENYEPGGKGPIPYRILATCKGSQLEGCRYEPPFSFPANSLEAVQAITPEAKPWVVMNDTFVTTEDGTGIVHTAPAFGADDYKVGKRYGIGILTLVDREGKFVDGLGEFSGRFVKDYKNQDGYSDVNVDLSVQLKLESKAFKVEKYEHNYPHCWRTDKPILYYPLDAWFIRTTALKDRMVEANNTIRWKPASTGTGRFGNWLENVVDWNLSRSRYWGTPLPIWKSEDGEEVVCIGSIAELSEKIQATHRQMLASSYTSYDALATDWNIAQGVEALKTCIRQKTDVPNAMYRHDLPEVEGITFVWGLPGDSNALFRGGFGLSHIIAKRESETGLGIETAVKLVEVIAKGEILKEVPLKKTIHLHLDGYEAVLSKDRFGEKETWLLTGWEIKKDKPDAGGEFGTTATPTHIAPTFSRDNVVADLSEAKIQQIIRTYRELDLHKPYVDDIFFISPSGKMLRRVPDLIDVWFDSGAMPYAQWHFPFENKEKFFESYPADFIAEGVDQTRGWFYTLHAIAALIKEDIEHEATNTPLLRRGDGGEADGGEGAARAYKTVVSNGLVLDKDGNKMSKRLGNVVDPFKTLAEYGADATRWYLITNASPWDNLRFDLEGIREVQRKFFGTLYNTYQFFALYANVDAFDFSGEAVPMGRRPEIDCWVLSALHTLTQKVTEAYDEYEPTQAGRLIEDFVDAQLSNWYVRLCRRRFWKGELEEDKLAAYQTLYECLETVLRLMAPIAPFFADALYRQLNGATRRFAEGSIHHLRFPTSDASYIDASLEERMSMAQDTCSLVLSLRKKALIKVRQPLQRVMIPVQNAAMQAQLQAVEDLIKGEVNVKEIEYMASTEGLVKKKLKPNFPALGKKWGGRMKEIAAAIGQLPQESIAALEREGRVALPLPGDDAEVVLSEVEILSEDIPGWLVASRGTLTTALDITLTPELMAEGDAREFVNRIQKIRKDAGFLLTDRIRVEVAAPEALVHSLLQGKQYICAEILADNLDFLPQLDGGYDIELGDNLLKVTVSKIR